MGILGITSGILDAALFTAFPAAPTNLPAFLATDPSTSGITFPSAGTLFPRFAALPPTNPPAKTAAIVSGVLKLLF